MKGDATLCRIPLLDFLFFRGARARLGGRVRFMICGSAPIRGPVLSELSAVLGAVVCEGYGGTEYAAGGCITWPGDPMGGVGGPVACAEFCLESVPAFDCFAGADMPKATAGQDDGPPPRARGEILIRGPHVCAGYDLDEDKLTVTEDGWLRTGDVGVLRDNGTLEIIDRVKSLLKLSQGEYIAPVRVESALLECGAVSQVWVDAGRMMPAILAVAVLDPTTAPAWLAERGVTDPKNKAAVAAALLAEFRSISAAAGLNSLETVKGVIVEDESAMFSVDNGLLTASLKVIRGKLREKYTGQFTAMYKSLGIK
jgi:long-chain acyl-CoA synthetase